MRNGKIINVINVHGFDEDVPPDLNDYVSRNSFKVSWRSTCF